MTQYKDKANMNIGLVGSTVPVCNVLMARGLILLQDNLFFVYMVLCVYLVILIPYIITVFIFMVLFQGTSHNMKTLQFNVNSSHTVSSSSSDTWLTHIYIILCFLLLVFQVFDVIH